MFDRGPTRYGCQVRGTWILWSEAGRRWDKVCEVGRIGIPAWMLLYTWCGEYKHIAPGTAKRVRIVRIMDVTKLSAPLN